MKTTVSMYDFREAFRQAGRENFSYEALGLLFEYFEELEQDIGNEMELDVIAICCDYSEDDAVSIAGNYDIDLSEARDGADESSAYGLEQIAKAELEIVQDYLNRHTSVVGTTSNGSIIYADF